MPSATTPAAVARRSRPPAPNARERVRAGCAPRSRAAGTRRALEATTRAAGRRSAAPRWFGILATCALGACGERDLDPAATSQRAAAAATAGGSAATPTAAPPNDRPETAASPDAEAARPAAGAPSPTSPRAARPDATGDREGDPATPAQDAAPTSPRAEVDEGDANDADDADDADRDEAAALATHDRPRFEVAPAPGIAPSPATDGALTIADQAFTTRIEAGLPAARADTFSLADDKVYLWLELDSDEAARIVVTWRKGDDPRFEFALDVGQSPRWRTWAVKTIRARDVGRWHADVTRADDGAALDSFTFEITEDETGAAP